jgi:hypothetical protein
LHFATAEGQIQIERKIGKMKKNIKLVYVTVVLFSQSCLARNSFLTDITTTVALLIWTYQYQQLLIIRVKKSDLPAISRTKKLADRTVVFSFYR